MTSDRHLTLQELALRPSGEWSPRAQGWYVAHVVEGSGYWLLGGQARELNVDDGFVVAGGSTAVVRASSLGPMRLQYFTVNPQYLIGLLTVGEGRQIENLSAQTAGVSLVFTALEPLGQKMKHLAQLPAQDTLSLRCALLQVWSGAMTGLLAACPTDATGNKLRERFRDYISHVSEAELVSRALPELARDLHCSERHFSRLFREEFGEPLRARQIELRLQRARQLLLDSDDKIIHIAYESGYRHLGLFNAMFKRRFGVTPSEWRLQNRPDADAGEKKTPSRRDLPRRAMVSLAGNQLIPAGVGFTCFIAGLGLCSAHAQTNHVKSVHEVVVKHYEIEGNSVLPPDVIAAVLTNRPGAFGTNVSFDTIRTELADLTLAYRERGYVTAAVTLPPQRLTNATMHIKVIEGRVTDIRVTGNEYFSSNNVMHALPSLHTNILLNSHVFQREVDTANASRDRQIYPVISPGPDPGTTLLTLKVKDQLPLHSRLEANNDYTPGTPDLRFAYNAQYDNLWDHEHQIGFSYSFSPVNFSHIGQYNLTPFDDPQVASYSGYYQIPLGGYQPVQRLIDENPASFGYSEVNHEFRLPPSTGRPTLTFFASRFRSDTGVVTGSTGSPGAYTGTFPISVPNGTVATNTITVLTNKPGQNLTLNENAGFSFSFPLRPMGSINSGLNFGLDAKRYASASYNTNVNILGVSYSLGNHQGGTNVEVFPQPQTTRYTTLDYFPLNIGWSGSRPDKWGATFFHTRLDFNALPVEAEFDPAGQTRNRLSSASYTSSSTNGMAAQNHYLRFTGGMDRLQTIYHDWTMKLHVDGQWADTPLFSNEQYGMGGTGGVRGYSEGDFYGDTGWRVAVEPQTPLIDLGMVDGDEPLWVRSSVFMDYGEAYLINRPAALVSSGTDRQQFLGVGWTFTANIGNHWDGRVTVSCPLISSVRNTPSGPAGTSVGDIHVYFGVGAQF